MNNVKFSGVVANYAQELISNPRHILICGQTGAGKSCVEFALINSMFYCEQVPHFILIDPKAVDLWKYAKCKNTLSYCDEASDAIKALNRAVDIMQARYKEMRRNDTAVCTARPVYIIIDELADLVLQDKRIFNPLQRLLAKGRQARVFCLLCTQLVNREVLPSLLRANVNTTICLHCENATASRLVIGKAGAENLPEHGRAYIKDAHGLRVVDIPYLTPEELRPVIEHFKK